MKTCHVQASHFVLNSFSWHSVTNTKHRNSKHYSFQHHSSGSENFKYNSKKSYRPGVAHRVDKDIVLLFHDRGTRKGWVVSSTPAPAAFYLRERAVPILQEAGWAPGPVWTGGKSRPHRDSIPDRPARSSVAIPTELPFKYNSIKYNAIINFFFAFVTLCIQFMVSSLTSNPKIFQK